MKENKPITSLLSKDFKIVTNQPIELVTTQDLVDFMDSIKFLQCTIYLAGYDENGNSFCYCPQSVLGTLYLKAIFSNYHREDNGEKFDKIDWSTLSVIADADIYTAISKFAKITS